MRPHNPRLPTDESSKRETIVICNKCHSLVLGPEIHTAVVENGKFVHKLCSESILNAKTDWQKHKIPKIAHFYWSESTIPFLRYLTLYSFNKVNPEWQIKFYFPKYRTATKSWTSQEHKTNGANYCDYYGDLQKLPIEFIEFDFSDIGIRNDLSEVHKSDLLRWHLLSAQGGLWSDTDIVYFRGMDRLLFESTYIDDIDTLINLWPEGRGKITANLHSIGFILGSSNNTYYNYIAKKSKEKHNFNSYQAVGAELLGDLFPTLESIVNKFKELRMGNIPMDVVYPYNSFNIHKIYNRNEPLRFTARTLGLHWYGGHRLAAKSVTELTKENFRQYNNVLSKTIELALE